MISAADLSMMRAMSLDALPETFTQTRGSTETPDGSGGYTLTAASITTTLRGRFAPATGKESQFGGMVIGVNDFILTFPANTDVRVQDRLTAAARAPAPAHTFEVKAVLHRSDEVDTRVLATEV